MLVIWKEFILVWMAFCLQCHDYIDGNGSEIPLVIDICIYNLTIEGFLNFEYLKTLNTIIINALFIIINIRKYSECIII